MSGADPLPGRDLAAFVAALETRSIQGAADELQLTQSAATKRVQALERRVGGALFERTRRGVAPTALAERLYPRAKEALAALARAEAAVGAPSLAVRLAASQTVGEFLLPGWLGRFAQTAPDVTPELAVVNSLQVAEQVRAGRVDVGFVEGGRDDRGLESLTLMRDEIAVVVAADHRWARARSIARGALTQERYLTREPGSGTRALGEAALAAHGITLTPALQTTSATALKRAVRTQGFTLLSRLAVTTELEHGTLVALPVAGVDLHRELRAIRRRRPAPTGPARRLWRWLEEQAA
jgi:DNA-binding transcriptional LysR family regulator